MHLSVILAFPLLAFSAPTVKTTSGSLLGISPRPNVDAYLGIPYAQPPLGDLRFAPPRPFNSSASRECFHSSPGCFQVGASTAFSDKETGTAESEDMLSINIYKPSKSKASLPVLIFLYGGAFTGGANALPGYDGTELIADQQSFIMATINYRVNVFGFPNSPAIKTKNVGLLDQRLGVEWLRDNIAAFGGDPKRMTLSGHSAGSMSVSYWAHAYVNDPIVSGFIEFSGQPGLIANDDGSSWKTIANITSCANSNSDAELECMRKVPARDLKHALNVNNFPTIAETGITGGTPAVDNVTIFPVTAYPELDKAGKFAKLPLLIAHTANEADGFLPFSPTGGVNQTLSDEFTLASWHCPIAATAGNWASHDVPTYRYLYNGTFAEAVPYSWMRPFHGSDQPLIFALERPFAYQALGPEIIKAGKYMRKVLTSFVQDPANGLKSFGWPKYDQNGTTLVKLFGNNSVEVTFESPAVYDKICQSF